MLHKKSGQYSQARRERMSTGSREPRRDAAQPRRRPRYPSADTALPCAAPAEAPDASPQSSVPSAFAAVAALPRAELIAHTLRRFRLNGEQAEVLPLLPLSLFGARGDRISARRRWRRTQTKQTKLLPLEQLPRTRNRKHDRTHTVPGRGG